VTLLQPHQWLLLILISFFAAIAHARIQYPAVFDTTCAHKVGGSFETNSIKQAKQGPVELYSIFYHRYLASLKSKTPGNFPVDDLNIFTEDMNVLGERLEYAKKYFEARQFKEYLEITQSLINRLHDMRSQGYGYLEYNTFGEFCNAVADAVLFYRLGQTTDVPGFPVFDRVYNFAWGSIIKKNMDNIRSMLSQNIRITETSRGSIREYYDFPFFALPTVSDTSRMDIVLISSAPFWIKKWPGEVENVDNRKVDEPPTANSEHDDAHVELAEIPKDLAPGRFKNDWDKFYLFLQNREKVTRYIVKHIESVADPVARLRLDQMTFSGVHEINFGSIEMFSPAYRNLLKNHKNKNTLIDESRFIVTNRLRDNFLSDAEREILKQASSGKFSLIVSWQYNQLRKQIERWYLEGGGP